jgi:hypothetical protein
VVPRRSSREGCAQQNHEAYWGPPKPGAPSIPKAAAIRGVSGLVGTATEGVADGSADSEHVAGAEAVVLDVGVVLDVIVVNLGTDKKVVPGVIADAAGEMLHEVIGADIVRSARTAGRAGGVESGAGSADTTHKVEAKFLSQTRLVEQVEIGQDGAVVFFSGEIDALSSPPGGLDVNAEAVLQKDRVPANVDVKAAVLRRQKKCVAVGSRRQGCTAANEDINLLVGSHLGGRKLGEEQKSQNRYENRQLSQENLLNEYQFVAS